MDTLIYSFKNNISWLYSMICFKTHWYHNYFWGLIVISLIVWGLEILFPWRKKQNIFRKDFWLDFFYMFFNFFVFTIIITGFYVIVGNIFGKYDISLKSLTIVNINDFNSVEQLVIFFIVSDFFQWVTHIILHRVPFFWKFHQVHHSVKEMGFAAHLRYHWMENVLYKPLKTLAVMLLGGFEPEQAYVVHFIAIIIGHINHSNLNITWGPLKYLLNNPVMHLYHHAYELPKDKKYGMNYGISLSLWDYIFGTYYIPKVDKYLKLGFKGDQKFPKTFIRQLLIGFFK